MPYTPYQPNPHIVERAVDLWVQMLENPRYDNGDLSLHGTMASMLADEVPRNNTPEILDRFRVELRRCLIEPFTSSYTRSGVTYEETRLVEWLRVDYDPDEVLRTAAERAGLEMQFPWKTSMTLEAGCLSVMQGYGAEPVYHYPLQDGRWLTSTLRGTDVAKVIAAVEEGVLDLDLSINRGDCAL